MSRCCHCGYEQDVKKWHNDFGLFLAICDNCGNVFPITPDEAGEALPLNTIIPIIFDDDDGNEHIIGRVIRKLR